MSSEASRTLVLQTILGAARMLTESGVRVIKLWLDISREEQARRLAERIGDPLKRFKVSSLDAEAQARWSDYSAARDRMLAVTHSRHAPWTVIATDDKKTARLNIIRHVLRAIGGPSAVMLECSLMAQDSAAKP